MNSENLEIWEFGKSAKKRKLTCSTPGEL